MATNNYIVPSNGNVFDALNLPDAKNLKIRSDLMIVIAKYVKKHKLTQAEAAKRMKVTQPQLNDVIKGRIQKCTIDRLVKMLDAIGHDVTVKVHKAA